MRLSISNSSGLLAMLERMGKAELDAARMPTSFSRLPSKKALVSSNRTRLLAIRILIFCMVAGMATRLKILPLLFNFCRAPTTK